MSSGALNLMQAKKPARSRTASLALEWLGRDTAPASVLATARHLLAIEAAVTKALPAALGRQCKVARLEAQRLTLAVPGPAHAAKLRQLTPSLLARLAAQGWNINEIGIRVQAGLMAPVTKPTTRNVEPLDANALQAFSTLADTLTPGPLASAIDRLLKHHNYR